MDTRHFIVEDIFGIDNIRNCEEYVLSIQRRLDKAVADNDTKGIRETFDLLAKRSMAVRTLSTKRITSDNKGKYTTGVDGIAMPKDDRQLQNQMRLKLLDKIDIQKKPDNIKRIHIPKPNGKKRPLGIPTIHDRIIQDILRTALEPIVEYHFSPNSYGFRPKRSCQDAQGQLFKKLGRTTSPKYVIEGDIKGCFDNINHEHIINTLLEWQVPIWATEIIQNILKTDIFHNGEVYDNDTGTPQGGVISPLLANVALTTLDNFCQKYGHKQWSKIKGSYIVNPIIRYADDFVIVCKSEPQAKQIKEEIAEHLTKTTGLTLSKEKTKITHIKHGFNFLGFNFRKYKPKGKSRSPIKKSKKSDYVLLIKPEKEKVKNLLRNVKEVLDKNKSATQNAVIKILNPKLRGWGMYYRFVSSKRTFAKIDHEIWQKTFWWAKRRHPNKSKEWIIRKYFTGEVKNRKTVFRDTEKNNDIFTLAYIPIKRHVLVNGNIRVYDQHPDSIEYWKKREYTNAFKQIESVRINNLYKRQKGICDYCNKIITATDIKETEVHVHHMKPRSFGGNESYSNLKLLHSDCHRELHRKITRKDMSDLSDKKVKYLMSETLSMYWRAVCGESRTHGSVRAVEGRPSMATLQLQSCNLATLQDCNISTYPLNDEKRRMLVSRKKRKVSEPTLGSRIQKARQAMKFSVEELAGKVGMRPQYILDIENDLIGNIPADVLMRVARALGTTIADLCGLPKRTAPQGRTPGEPLHYRRGKAR